MRTQGAALLTPISQSGETSANPRPLIEKVRQILDARDAGKLDDADADKEIQREYPAA
jgi:hypothetical protein